MWYAKRGKGLPIRDHGVSQGIFTEGDLPMIVLAPRPRRLGKADHSAKPDEAYKALEQLFGPDVRRLDLFARQRRPGWSAWGNELPEEGASGAA